MSKGIFVVMEQRYGKVQNVGLELVGEATRLKEDLKDDVVAVLLGHDIKGEVDKIFHYGADKVVLVDDPMLKDYVTQRLFAKLSKHLIPKSCCSVLLPSVVTLLPV